METQLKAKNVVPQELGDVVKADANSFKEALEILESNDTGKRGLSLQGPIRLNEDEVSTLKLLPKAFDLNRTMQELWFKNLEVDDILVAEALKAGTGKNTVTSIVFFSCKKVHDRRLLETMCQGLKERSTVFQLVLSFCSSDFAKSVVEAAYFRCFSLQIQYLDCSKINRPLKNLFVRGRLYYIRLTGVKGLKEDFFLLLGRCLLPNLAQLELFGTEIPTGALKSFHGALKSFLGSLKLILDSARSNVLERLSLGGTEMGDKLSFAYFSLLHSDMVDVFCLKIKKDISKTVVKNICSTVEKTKNLRYLVIRKLSPGTKFKTFELQENRPFYKYPFGVNPIDT